MPSRRRSADGTRSWFAAILLACLLIPVGPDPLPADDPPELPSESMAVRRADGEEAEPPTGTITTAGWPIGDSDGTGLNLAWRKGEYTVVPYGIGWLNIAWDSSRTQTGAFTLYVLSEETQGEPSFTVNARATRLGVDVTGPKIVGADSSGRIEFDFFGQALSENRASVLLRQAYGEFAAEGWRVVGGQTNDVISPLDPHVLNYSVARGGGNIGYRRPQLRGELFVPLADDIGQMTLQASISRTVVNDFASDPVTGGEDAGWPTVMGRAALALGEGETAVIAGLSSHIGEEGVDFGTDPIQDDARFLSWSLNLDLTLPASKRFGLRGEFFWGDVLGTFQGGIIQEINPIRRTGIRSIGGWGEVWFYPTEKWRTHAGLGIDDPYNSDLSDAMRSQNQFYFANVIYRFTPLFTVGLEVSWWETRFVGLADGKALRIETVMQYRF